MSCGDIQDEQGIENREEAVMLRRKQVRRADKSKCQKCLLLKSMYIIRNITFCRSCFEQALFARFMKTLHPPLKPSLDGKSKSTASSGYRPPQQLGSAVVALSTGCGSTALLDFLLSRHYIGKGGDYTVDKTKGEKEPIWRKGWVVYVDFANVLDGVDSRMEEVKEWVETNKGLGYIGISAEEIYDATLVKKLKKMAGIDSADEYEVDETFAVDFKNPLLPLVISPLDMPPGATPVDKFRTLLSSLSSASRPQLLSHVLSAIIALVARILPSISHVLLGETSTRQAQRLIAGTALGRGWQLPLEISAVQFETSLSEASTNGLTWLKPMKDITTKEAAIYCHLKGLSMWTRNGRMWETGIGKSSRGKYQTLLINIKDFVASLSVTHPSTVSTINRTGDKLVFPGEKNGPCCPVCQMPVDPSALEWKSRTALTSLTKSKFVSGSSTKSFIKSRANLNSLLCYSCLTTFTLSATTPKSTVQESSQIPLPPWISTGVAKRLEGRALRDEIKDYIIE
nr:hypothetical protein L204_01356 [Cryptococcus depauperatus CBS 7855]